MRAKEQLYRVTLSYAVFGVIVVDGQVVHTAPIGKWMLKKSIGEIRKWVKSKKGSVRKI